MRKLKIPMLAATFVMGLGSLSSTAFAAERHLDRHIVNLSYGFAILGIVADTPEEFTQAQREADQWEGRRHLGLGPQTIAAVAIYGPDVEDELNMISGTHPAATTGSTVADSRRPALPLTKAASAEE